MAVTLPVLLDPWKWRYYILLSRLETSIDTALYLRRPPSGPNVGFTGLL